MPKNHNVGDSVVLTFNKRYIESGAHYELPGKVVYAPDTDRMKSWYDKYVFDGTEFASVTTGRARVTILAVADKATKLDDPNLPQPEGGFANTYYSCKIVEALEASQGDNQEED